MQAINCSNKNFIIFGEHATHAIFLFCKFINYIKRFSCTHNIGSIFIFLYKYLNFSLKFNLHEKFHNLPCIKKSKK
ncbi:hypothetical protein C7C56_016655 [Massilia glaciei]|uniref:Uncharacterized protein n=1 Tax=Massilia glaciei TaxID=1524097 RepID=A0A2U2HIL8_9BURK|nr:hypothetical protein C7C56_016655 [Massilia glaciei]